MAHNQILVISTTELRKSDLQSKIPIYIYVYLQEYVGLKITILAQALAMNTENYIWTPKSTAHLRGHNSPSCSILIISDTQLKIIGNF